MRTRRGAERPLQGIAVWLLALVVLTSAAGEDSVPSYPDKLNLLVVRDQNGKESPVRSTADWGRRREHILSSMELVMGRLPGRAAASTGMSRQQEAGFTQVDIRAGSEERFGALIRKKITFDGGDGDPVPAWLLIPAKTQGKARAMLCLHQTTPIGKDEPAGAGGKTDLHYAEELAERGFVALAPDYPNFGEYKLDAYARGYVSATMKGIVNHRRAVDVLASLPEVDPKAIGVIGHSLGGHNALFLAAFDTRVRAVITSCGFNSFAEYNGGDLTGWSHGGYMPRIASVYGKQARLMPFDFTEVLAAVAPRPVFINAPLHDTNFPVKGVKDCVAAAQPVYELFGAKESLVVTYPDCGHEFPRAVREAAYDWLQRELVLSAR